MKIADAIQYMSKSYLHRIIDSFTEDIPKRDPEDSRKRITQHKDDLSDHDRIQKRLDDRYTSYPDRILKTFVLETFLNLPTSVASQDDVYRAVREKEQSIIDASKRSDCFQYTDEHALDVFTTVLQVAVQDGRISADELPLIERLRRRLDLTEREQYLALAQLGHFPRRDNAIHTSSEIGDALTDLQKTGVVFYCNRHPEGSRFVVPEELEPGVRNALGFELPDSAYRRLLEKLTKDQLYTILDKNGLPTSGRKNEQVQRVIETGIQPSQGLDALNSDDLYGFLDGLPGAKVSGTKEDRIKRIIEYFANRTIREVPPGDDPRRTYYEYLVELAKRDRENLYANNVISKDIDIERAFEEGTRYLFEEKLKLDLIELDGSERPDGAVSSTDGKGLLMWDNKSKEDVYTFPNSHVKQFSRYIREADDRVSCFLVVTPEIGDKAHMNMHVLKAKSPDDTDVALITAENLRWVAENWTEETTENRFNPEVFNLTAVLTRQVLKQRIGMFL